MLAKQKPVRPAVAMILVGAIALVSSVPSNVAAAAPADSTSHQRTSAMKIRIILGGRVINATLANNETAKDFASLLPLTLTLNDLFSREKFAKLPRAISTAGPRSRTYSVGDIILWSPVLTLRSSIDMTDRRSRDPAASSSQSAIPQWKPSMSPVP